MENVEGILRPENRALLDAAISQLPSRYHVLQPQILTAADYGAATTRRRVAIVGFDIADFPTLSVADFQPAASRRVNVREAIADLPGPILQNDDKEDLGWNFYPPCKEELTRYAAAARALPPLHLSSAQVRERLRQGQVSGLFDTKHSESIAARYASVPAGKTDPITKSYKLDWNGQCPTLRAGTGSERGGFQAVRPLHPDEARVITVREAARLQGFPDWFQFHPTKWQSFRMIGNSVSPLVSYGLLNTIAGMLSVRVAA